MNTKKKDSVWIAVLIAGLTFGLAPASADKGEALASVTVTMVTAFVVEASPETPQDMVWDMTYGPEQPVAAEEMVAAADDSAIVDYTFG